MALGLKGKILFRRASIIALGPVLLAGFLRAASVPAPAPKCPERQLSCPAKFITCMAWDKFRQCVWVGTEGHGIYEYRPWARQGKRWLHFSKANGLSDNSCYAIAIDDKARVWAGTDRHGVDVFINRNKPWQRYDVLPLVHKGRFGPLGSHPFCIGVDPYTHAVWLGTEAGISIYSTRRHDWHYLTVANGLPSNQINAIGFLPQGKVIVGTQCEGLDIGTPERHRPLLSKGEMVLSTLPGFRDPYKWRVITGPFHTPASATGDGLPDSLINAIATSRVAQGVHGELSAYQIARAARHQSLYVGTDSGLAVSRNGGASWRFEQGRDYAARVLGLFHPPAGFHAPPEAQLANLLSGEHITCIARDAAGNLWLGFWRDGCMVISPHGQHIYRTDGDPRFAKVDSYVQAILPLPNGKVLVGRYGHGVSVINPGKLADWLKPANGTPLAQITAPNRMLMPVMVSYPKAAAVPSVQQIVALRNALVKIRPDRSTAPEIISLSDDWRTRGNELDNYGRLQGYLGAMNHIIDQFTSEAGWFHASCEGYMNQYWNPKDGIRRWVSNKFTTDPRALENPSTGSRTMSSWDDHGEAYSPTIDGPNLYFTLALPPGTYVMSLYFVNDDAHAGAWNRPRDYGIQIRPTKRLSLESYGKLPFNGGPGVRAFASAAVYSAARVANFFNGVYKRFLVVLPAAGGRMLTIRVDRNHSTNTITSGIFIDRLFALPKQRVVPPLVLEHRPFRSWQQWRRTPIPSEEVAEVAKIFYRGDLLQFKLGHGMTRHMVYQDAMSTARQEILSRDVLRPHPRPLPTPPVPQQLIQQLREAAPANRWRILHKIGQAQAAFRHRLWATPAGCRELLRLFEAHLSPADLAVQAVMRQLLYLRQADAGAFVTDARPAVVELCHFLLMGGPGSRAAADLVGKRPAAGWPVFSRYYLASLAADVGMPVAAEHIYFRTDNYQLFGYSWESKHKKEKLPQDGVAYQRLFRRWTQKQQERKMLKWPERQNNG
jgi:hypothetical protein